LRSVDVVVIGAGVVGASVAYHLAARGCSRVLVLDRGEQPGQGSTCRATGGFRAQFGSAINVRLSLLSREKLRRFQDEIGVNSGYRPSGYLFLARHADELAALLAAQHVQHAAGLYEARQVDPGDIQHLNPAVHRDSPTVALLGHIGVPASC
jgi:sarcosine oxidase subunit beta